MRFRCIVSFQSSRSKTVSNWRTSIQSPDVVSAADLAVAALKRRQRRALNVVGIYVYVQEPQSNAR